MKQKYQVIYYTANNQSPVQKFINSLDHLQKAKIRRTLQQIKNFGLITIKNKTKKLAGTPLWELKIVGKDNIRLLYFYLKNNNLCILHGFIKKKQKTPLKEIKIAINHYQKLTN
ncbi:type II toxin-antitoxin system RelE/ParE family toxin [Patescibacteria group bacterium]|nr:type II toxin-antitoxin system RelE/ParE family toxin [Patescibacteria group bacterium]